MSAEPSTIAIEAMMVRTKMLQNRRSPFDSPSFQGVKSGFENYLLKNQNELGSENEHEQNEHRRSMKNENGYVPQFNGYLNIGFSFHVPCDHTMADCKPDIDDEDQGRLESLVMLYLCSQGTELVISTSPNTLLHVCPFNGSNNGGIAAKTKSTDNILMDGDEAPMILWNLPKFEYETIAFDADPEEAKTVVDMATNTKFYMTKKPLQYYTQLVFTYPVYQWGSEDEDAVEVDLQRGFDTGVISSGTLNSLLPWSDAVAAPIGSEPYVFWNEPLPGTVRYYDTTMPHGVGLLLRWMGCGLLGINTLLCLLLSVCARRRSIRKDKEALLAKQEQDRRTDGWNSGDASSRVRHDIDYLDTEAGVSAILMESKQYALTKSGVGKHNGDRNITGVEVDLKMVDHPSHLRNQLHHQHHHHPETSTGYSVPMTAEEKEDMLLARARYRSAPVPRNSNEWYSGEKLLNGNGDDDYDDDDETDLQILDLVPPPSTKRTEEEKASAC